MKTWNEMTIMEKTKYLDFMPIIFAIAMIGTLMAAMLTKQYAIILATITIAAAVQADAGKTRCFIIEEIREAKK